MCIPMNFAKFLRTPFPKEHLCWLLLKVVIFSKFETSKILIQNFNDLENSLSQHITHNKTVVPLRWCYKENTENSREVLSGIRKLLEQCVSQFITTSPGASFNWIKNVLMFCQINTFLQNCSNFLLYLLQELV